MTAATSHSPAALVVGAGPTGLTNMCSKGRGAFQKNETHPKGR